MGLNFGGAALKLPRVVQDHCRAPVHGLDGAAYTHVSVQELPQFADLRAIFFQANDGELTALIRCVGRTDVKVTGSVGQFDHVVDMRGDTNILVRHLRRLFGGDARLRIAGQGYRRAQDKH